MNIIVVTFKVLPFGRYSPMPAPSQPFKAIFKWFCGIALRAARRITPDVISVIKMPPLQYFLYLQEQKNIFWLDSLSTENVPAQLFVS
jgi:hypothetical protein